MKSDQQTARPINLTLWIMGFLLVWGGYLAIGALRAGGNHASARGLIVFACTLGFLVLWWAALSARKRRLEKDAEGP